MAADNALRREIRRFNLTGFGVNPRQPALNHVRGHLCRCHWCVGAPIVITEAFPWPA